MNSETSAFELHKKQFEELEYKLLFYSGLSIPDQIYSLNVPVLGDSWIHEITCGNSQKHIVLLHGYGGTSLTFIRMFKLLSEHYTVHALDFLGMGLSHRRQFNPKWKKEEIIDYYIDGIEEWRKQRKINRMTIVGHSYGGYLASCYAFKYIARIERLCLISPAGTKTGSDQTYQQDYDTIYNQSSCFRKILLSIFRKVIKWEPTPSSAMNWCCIGPIIMDRALTGRLRLQNQQKSDWKLYMKRLSQITPNIVLYAFGKYFSVDFQNVRIDSSSFGDSDWMQKQTALNLSKTINKINRISYTVIPNSGHQILFDNPQQMGSYLI